MKKKKNILREPGVLLVAAILVLTSIVVLTSTTTVTKAQATHTLPFSEDFSGTFPPTGWTTDYWTQSATNEACGTSSPEARVYKYDQYYGGQYYDNFIMTPAIDASSCSKVQLKFNFAADIVDGSSCSFYIKYKRFATAPWTDITSLASPTFPYPITSDISCTQFTIDIDCSPNHCGDDFQVKWEYLGYYYYYNYFYLDDVEITCLAPIPPPCNIQIGNIWVGTGSGTDSERIYAEIINLDPINPTGPISWQMAFQFTAGQIQTFHPGCALAGCCGTYPPPLASDCDTISSIPAGSTAQIWTRVWGNACFKLTVTADCAVPKTVNGCVGLTICP